MAIDCKMYLDAMFDYFFDLSEMSDESLADSIVAAQEVLIVMQKEQSHRDYQRADKLLSLDEPKE